MNPKPRRRRGPKVGPLEVDPRYAKVFGLQAPSEPKACERYVSPNEAGRLLNVTGEAVKQWIYRGRLPATKLSNGYYKIRVADLQAFLKARNDYSRKRVLVLSVNEKVRETLLAGVRAAGHEPIAARNRTDALLKSADLKPSAFIIDTDLPGRLGWRFFESVRKGRHVRNAAVLLVSTVPLSESEEDLALKLQAQGLLRTPLTAQQVDAELKGVLMDVLQ